jgi:UDP-2,3-diacylglucosamine pyrophosphatase LpxH
MMTAQQGPNKMNKQINEGDKVFHVEGNHKHLVKVMSIWPNRKFADVYSISHKACYKASFSELVSK